MTSAPNIEQWRKEAKEHAASTKKRLGLNSGAPENAVIRSAIKAELEKYIAVQEVLAQSSYGGGDLERGLARQQNEVYNNEFKATMNAWRNNPDKRYAEAINTLDRAKNMFNGKMRGPNPISQPYWDVDGNPKPSGFIGTVVGLFAGWKLFAQKQWHWGYKAAAMAGTSIFGAALFAGISQWVKDTFFSDKQTTTPSTTPSSDATAHSSYDSSSAETNSIDSLGSSARRQATRAGKRANNPRNSGLPNIPMHDGRGNISGINENELPNVTSNGMFNFNAPGMHNANTRNQWKR